MGVQTGTNACLNAYTPASDPSISICPKGWRLPTGSGGSPTNEFQNLNTAINSGSTSSDNGLRSTWLGQYSGYYHGSFIYQGSYGYYWSSTQYPSNTDNAWILAFNSGYVRPGTSNANKGFGWAVRCLQ
jgi:uncharacterized protein (TIGR02145 family)